MRNTTSVAFRITIIWYIALNGLFYGILHNQSCQHHAENGSDVNDAAVAFVVRVYGHFVLQKFVGKDALELTLWKLFVAFETIAKGTGKGVARYLPELSGLDTCRVELKGCPHGREELRFGLASQEDEQRLVLQ